MPNNDSAYHTRHQTTLHFTRRYAVKATTSTATIQVSTDYGFLCASLNFLLGFEITTSARSRPFLLFSADDTLVELLSTLTGYDIFVFNKILLLEESK